MERGNTTLFVVLWILFWGASALTSLIVAAAESPSMLVFIPILVLATLPMCVFQRPLLSSSTFPGIPPETTALVDCLQGTLFTIAPGLALVLVHTCSISAASTLWGLACWASFYTGYIGALVATTADRDDGM